MIKDSLKTIALSLAILSLISVAYAWTEPSSNPPAGNVSAPINTSGTGQIKSGSLQVNGFRNLGGTALDGTLSVGGNITSGGQSVITSLSAGSGISISGSGNSRTITSTGVSESDPTVPASIKDGVAWTEISSRPAGLDDGDQVASTAITSSGSYTLVPSQIWVPPAGIYMFAVPNPATCRADFFANSLWMNYNDPSISTQGTIGLFVYTDGSNFRFVNEASPNCVLYYQKF